MVIIDAAKQGDHAMKYGYARVSTQAQSLEAQVDELKKEGCEVVYQEKFTGKQQKDFVRPVFNELLGKLEKGDTLVVTKLDRFARSAKDALNVIDDLKERGIRVHILNMGIVENTPTGNLLFTVMSGFAQFERDMIVERTQSGKAIAKQREDFKEGRPKKYTKKQVEHALSLLESHSYKEVEAITGISKSTLIRAKRETTLGET
jgi:DNA invertase Pin-like site-specific DNA recombinase